MTKDEQIEFLRVNTSFGCLTRQALQLDIMFGVLSSERLSIVYWDLDGLKNANETMGEEIVNLKVRQSLNRWTDRVYSWFSGDEFVAFIRDSDAAGFARRLQVELRSHGLRATFCIVDNNSPVPEDQIKVAVSRVKAMKKTSSYGRVDDMRYDSYDLIVLEP